MSAAPLAWSRILRLGLIQAALGAMVVLATSTFGRIMTIEAGLPALVPGLLVGLHYAVQLLRPRFGHGSDIGGLRTPWILGGLAVLAAGTVIAAIGTALAGSLPPRRDRARGCGIRVGRAWGRRGRHDAPRADRVRRR